MDNLSPENRARRGALLVTITGILTARLFVIMVIYAGSNPKPYTHPNQPGFNQAMIWLELAADLGEVNLILGPPDDARGKAIRGALDRANYVDFAFMIAYSALMFCLFIFTHILCRNAGRGLLGATGALKLGMLLALIMYVGDVAETILLLIVTGPPDQIGADIVLYLNIATRVKWAAIFIASLMLGAGYAAYFRFSAGTIIALAFSICGMLGMMGIIVQSARPLVEAASGLLAVAWFASLAHAVFVLVRKPEE